MAASSDLSNITGSCAKCKRTNLIATDFIEAHLRQFLLEQTSSRGRSQFADARESVRSETARVEVAGANLFCRHCVEQSGADDGAWHDDEPAAVTSCATTATDTSQQLDVAESWEDDDVAESWEDT